MSAKTRIWVFHMRELIYTAIFAALGILFLLLLIFMFSASPEAASAPVSAQADASLYRAGVYTASLTLGGNPVEIAVTVDEDRITAIGFRELGETVSAMYPLMEPALGSLSDQICASQSLDNITYSEESQYTSMLLLDAIQTALAKAAPAP